LCAPIKQLIKFAFLIGNAQSANYSAAKWWSMKTALALVKRNYSSNDDQLQAQT
jgi:hypothetical protein